MARSSVMFGSSSTTSTRVPFTGWPFGRAPSVFTSLMVPWMPVSLLRAGWGAPMKSTGTPGPRRPARDATDDALAVDQPRRQAVRPQPCDRRFTHHDRCCRSDVGVDAGAGDHGRGLPRAVGRLTCGRVDDVVKHDPAAGPAAPRGDPRA